jgi:hypothetical protein
MSLKATATISNVFLILLLKDVTYLSQALADLELKTSANHEKETSSNTRLGHQDVAANSKRFSTSQIRSENANLHSGRLSDVAPTLKKRPTSVTFDRDREVSAAIAANNAAASALSRSFSKR